MNSQLPKVAKLIQELIPCTQPAQKLCKKTSQRLTKTKCYWITIEC